MRHVISRFVSALYYYARGETGAWLARTPPAEASAS